MSTSVVRTNYKQKLLLNQLDIIRKPGLHHTKVSCHGSKVRTVASLLFIFLVVGSCLSEDSPFVTTNSGKIRGRYLTSYKGNRYEAYQGIPFAEPPVGDKRFQPPVVIQSWRHELKATNVSQPCPQKKSDEIIGSEDCLYLNVHVPTKRNTNGSLPVIFYIHGGAFQAGHIGEHDEHYIMDYDVIYVSTHYRLGVLGFLSTEDDLVPGNMGLKDQSMALRWTYDNIQHFGGDPKRITLVGQSAGGASVHFHYFSPWSRGLFHAGISLSGTVFAPWASAHGSLKVTMQLGQKLNCTNENVQPVVECLRTHPIDNLFPTLLDLEVDEQMRNQAFVWFNPVIEKLSANPFIDDLPSRIIEKGDVYDVPWITGVASEESLYVAIGGISYPPPNETRDAILKGINDNWMKMAPIWLDFYHIVPKEQYRNVSLMIREHYMKRKPIDRENARPLINLVSDRYFKTSAVVAATRQASANRGPVFFYQYSYRATDSYSKFYSNGTEDLGVAHCDDVDLILKNPSIGPTKSSSDMAMQRRLMQMWTSVARNGVPDMDIEWGKVSPNSDTFNYLQIDDPNSLAMRSSNDLFEKKFWNSLALDKSKI